MKRKILVMFCEGKHDSAFLSLVLKSIGYKNFTKPISELPTPFYFIGQRLKGIDLETLHMGQVSDDTFINPFPWIFIKEDSYVSIFPMNGIDKILNLNPILFLDQRDKLIEKGLPESFFTEAVNKIEYLTRDELIEKINSILNAQGESLDEASQEIKAIRTYSSRKEMKELLDNFLHSETENQGNYEIVYPINFCFFIDADDTGVKERAEKFINQYKNIFNGIENIKNNNPVIIEKKRKVGLFIFQKNPPDVQTPEDNLKIGTLLNMSNTGTLEDILISIINKTNYKDLLANSEKFIQANLGLVDSKSSVKFYEKKSILTAAGQLKCSSFDLGFIISRGKKGFIDPEGSFKDNQIVKNCKKFIKDMF